MRDAMIEVSVVLPCLNEESTIGTCIKKAKATFDHLRIAGEIVIVDNGSTDRSVQIAHSLGARVIHETRKGYGNALRRGFQEARGKYLIMADSDDSYDLTDLERFIQPLRNGADIVIGNRFEGQILPGAMPWKNRYIGNPILSGILKILFKVQVSDAHCGMRALRSEILEKLDLVMPGMEFASEMIIKAAKAQCKMVEVPITLHPDGRNRPPHLKPWRDGWRHLKLMLMLSPTHLFLIPGLAFLVSGMLLMLALLPGPIENQFFYAGPHWMVVGSLSTLLGFQIISLNAFAKAYASSDAFANTEGLHGLFWKSFTLDRGLLCGVTLTGIGLGIDLYVLLKWVTRHFGPLQEIHTAVFGSTFLVLGVQIIFSSFFLSILLENRRTTLPPGN